MRDDRLWKCVALTLAVVGFFSPHLTGAEDAEPSGGCAVTIPNDRGYVSDTTRLRHGNEWLATSLWPDGKVMFRPRGAGCIDHNGALWMKWPWWRKVSGSLEVETWSLDGTGAPLSAKVPCCYGNSGFQVSGLGFPGAGCWQITARVGQGSLSFVTLVEKVGEGPPACSAASPKNEMRPRPTQATEPRL